jgi:hypothetical protein
MADAKQMEFGSRLERIERTHRQLKNGYITSVNHDGLIIAKPHRRSSGRPMRGIFMSLLVLLAFKGFVYAQIGSAAYADRVGLLKSGTVVEQVGAYVMHADPITVWIADQINQLF